MLDEQTASGFADTLLVYIRHLVYYNVRLRTEELGVVKVCPACQQHFEQADWHCPRCGQRPQTIGDFTAFAPQLAQSEQGFEAGFFEALARLERGHFWFEARNRLLQWVARRYFAQSRSMLEIGCGTGFVLTALQQTLPHARFSGSDLFTEGLAFAAQRVPAAALFQMDARQMPFSAEFDLIGAFDVLEHIAEDETVLCEVYRALAPGGGLILTVPQHRFLWSVVDELSHHERRYSRRELVEKVERAGFKVLMTTSFVALLLPFMLLVRRGKKQMSADFDLTAELKISPRLNAVLTRVMRLETWLIERGLTFPAGGSLLLVAKKAL